MTYVGIIILVLTNVFYIFKNGANEARFMKIRLAVNRAYENAKPEDKNEVLDQLIKDIWNALYK